MNKRNKYGGFNTLEDVEEYFKKSCGLILKKEHPRKYIWRYILDKFNSAKKPWEWLVEYNEKLKTYYPYPPTNEFVEYIKSREFLDSYYKNSD